MKQSTFVKQSAKLLKQDDPGISDPLKWMPAKTPVYQTLRNPHCLSLLYKTPNLGESHKTKPIKLLPRRYSDDQIYKTHEQPTKTPKQETPRSEWSSQPSNPTPHPAPNLTKSSHQPASPLHTSNGANQQKLNPPSVGRRATATSCESHSASFSDLGERS